jgi:signal transduction histidine kinase
LVDARRTIWIGTLALALGGACAAMGSLPHGGAGWPGTVPPPSAPAWLLACTLLVVCVIAAGRTASRWSSSTRKVRGLASALLIGALLLAAGLILQSFERGALERHRGRVHGELVERGAEVSERWSALLEEMDGASRLPASLLAHVAVGPPGRAFEELASWSRAHRLLGAPAGIALFSPEGQPMVWTGPLGDLQALPSAGPRFRQTQIGTSSYLICRREILEGPVGVVQVELLLGSLASGGTRTISRALGLDTRARPGELVLPYSGTIPVGSSTIGLDLTQPAPAGTGPAVRVPLRGPDGSLLAVARLHPAPETVLSDRYLAARLLLISAAVLAALAVALALAYRKPDGAVERVRLMPTPAEALGLLLAVALARLGLSALLHGGVRPGAVTGPALFAIPAPFGLLASPADLLLTALPILLAAVIIVAARRTRPGGPGRPLPARLLLAAGGTALLVATVSFVFLLPAGGKINPARFQILQPEPPRIAIQAAAVALTAAPLALIFAALSAGLARREEGKPDRRPSLQTGILLTTLAALAAGGALIAGAHRASRLLVEQDLSRELRGREERLERILSEVIAHAADHPRWSVLLEEPAGPAGSALAYDTWSQTELAVNGTKSAVAVLDTHGVLRSEFTENLPPGINDNLVTAPPWSSVLEIGPDDYRVLSLRIPLLRGEGPLYADGEVVGRLVVQLSSEPDNIPFLTRNDPLATTHSAGGWDPIYDEFLEGEPALLVYSPGGEVQHSSALRPPSLRTGILNKLSAAGEVWRRFEVDGRPHWLFYFRVGEEIAAIGYPAAGFRERFSALIRFTLLALIGGFVLRAAAALTSHPAESLRAVTVGWVATLRRSYSRRLLAALLIASMLPLIGLSAYLRAQVRERTRSGLEASGIAALETARRLLQDYLEVGAVGEPGSEDGDAEGIQAEQLADPVDDDALFWLSRVVRQGLAVYVDGRLSAASRPDLYVAGLLPRCLDGEVARRILARREPYVLRDELLGTERAFFIYAPIALPGRAETGVLALPLTASQREQRREADAVGEGLLTATALLGALLAAIAFATSRRISEPIRGLTRAAARVAKGDYRVRLPVRTRDETGVMVDAFNRMAHALEGQREDLRRRGDYIEKILLNATTGVISTDPTGRIRTINPAARLLLESQEAVEGHRLQNVLRDRPSLEPIARLVDEALEGGDRKIEREVDVSSGSEERHLRCVILPLREEAAGPPGRIVLLEDLTEIVRSNRLAAWAEMARRIAHEIKNPLTPIQLSAEHMARLHRDADPALEHVLGDCIQTILSQVRALREISSEFSVYARLPALQLRPTDPATLVRDVLAPYRASPPERVRIEEDLSTVPEIPLDGKVLRRALVNLVENALQAMHDGGTLSVGVAALPDGGASITISDSGEGMDEATLARIFEPYFSTRDAGTGLGLAIARRAVEEHGGTLTAHSRAGRGTVMTIRLPRVGRVTPAPAEVDVQGEDGPTRA